MEIIFPHNQVCEAREQSSLTTAQYITNLLTAEETSQNTTEANVSPCEAAVLEDEA